MFNSFLFKNKPLLHEEDEDMLLSKKLKNYSEPPAHNNQNHLTMCEH